MKLIAKKSFPYDGMRLNPGDEFECDPRFVRTLVAIGHAEKAEAAVTAPVRRPRAARAQPGRYNRRDVRAQD